MAAAGDDHDHGHGGGGDAFAVGSDGDDDDDSHVLKTFSTLGSLMGNCYSPFYRRIN